ncbi:uncharacterized protein LOC117177475 [Belonocnema kinseyi]|uniref:uncharacterized protein LOC117177475 n=1 Tax=Belonocnema kinseyi TaxID=2817044 RepID=UPI00143DBB6A|nr:uncharacterized protein LOC117177475 [Belonocnema kinseyi]
MGKLAFAFLLLTIAAFSSATVQYSVFHPGNQPKNVYEMIQCVTECGKSYKDPVCTNHRGKYVTFGLQTCECIRDNCREDIEIAHAGPCRNPGYHKMPQFPRTTKI